MTCTREKLIILARSNPEALVEIILGASGTEARQKQSKQQQTAFFSGIGQI